MTSLFQQALHWIQNRESFVLATVVKTKGSTPQKAGAKMLVRSDGSIVGTLGGGCVEGDIILLAEEMLRKNRSSMLREYRLTEELAARSGLNCGGTMFIFMEPVTNASFATYLPLVETIVRAQAGGTPVAVATLVAAAENGPAPGAKLLIFEDGATEGTLGDAVLDEEAKKVGHRLAAFGDLQILQTENGAQIYIEGFTTPPVLVLMGGGHVNKAVADLAARMGYRIYVIDDRPEFASRERFPNAEKTIVAEYDAGLAQVPAHANTFIVVATRGHKYDDLALAAAVRTPARYVGLVGSRRKSLLIYRNLQEQGVPMERIQQVHAPIGLDIGAVMPEEIALSIMAEITMVRRGGHGGPLKMGRAFLEKQLVGK
ncbi:MAG: XdhC family protein [candidate division KSB1 bacterium]|nr:XdhC family protein [candidate division KSB1 bacterium]MDQ7063673.1 XdhC family protein [candidate division KSB1 bacterium]